MGTKLTIQIEVIREGAQVPVYTSAGAAGCDLYACPEGCDEIAIEPHRTVMVGTGLKAAVPEGWFGGIFARSGLAAKSGLRPANCVGVVDSDYRGEWMVALHNDSEEPQVIRRGDRIAQLVLLPCMTAEFAVTDQLDETERGAGGFGHSGR